MVVVHTFNPTTREAEAGACVSQRPAWSIGSSRTARAAKRKPVPFCGGEEQQFSSLCSHANPSWKPAWWRNWSTVRNPKF